MTLPEAEFIANEFNKFTSVLSAEVVPNVGGDYGVLVTRTDGRRAISSDIEAANDAHAILQIEEYYAQAVYATLGEGNVPVICSRETLEGMVGAKRRREGSQKRAIRGLRDQDNFHRLSIGRCRVAEVLDGRRSQHEDRHALLARKLHYPGGSGSRFWNRL